MSTATAPVVDLDERRSRAPAWVPLAAAAVAAALLGTTVDGTQATAVSAPSPSSGGASAAGTSAGSAEAGTLLLVLRDNGAALAQSVTGLAPGDRAVRYVDVVETGTLDGRRLAVSATATGALVPGLSVALDACRGGGWKAAAGTCSGTVVPLLPLSPLRDLAAPRVLDPLGPARRLPLRLTLALADRQERAVNGVLPPGSLQGTQARVSWLFTVVQG